MRRPRRPAPQPAAPPGHERGTREDYAQLLTAHGAERIVLPSGYWCYLLTGHDGLPFYPGMTGNLLRRLGEHRKTHGNRIASVWVIRCRSEHEARVQQFFFADRFAHCVEAFLGTEQYEAYRAELHRAAKQMDLPAHVTAAHEAHAAARERAARDRQLQGEAS